MARRKKPTKTEEAAPSAEPTDLGPFAAMEIQESQIFTGNQSLHTLFQEQIRQTLDKSDLDEDAKQAILVAMNCPCCGAGAMSYTAKINRRK